MTVPVPGGGSGGGGIGSLLEAGREGRAAAEAAMGTSSVTVALDQVRIELAAEAEATPGRGGGRATAPTIGAGAGLRPPPLRFVLEVTVGGEHRLEVPLRSELASHPPTFTKEEEEEEEEARRSATVLQELVQTYDPDASAAFAAVSLALRYGAPMAFRADALRALRGRAAPSMASAPPGALPSPVPPPSCCVVSPSSPDLSVYLPRWRSLRDLQATSDRAKASVGTGLEAHRLNGALRIALERGDGGAVARIRERLAELEGGEEMEEDTDGRAP